MQDAVPVVTARFALRANFDIVLINENQLLVFRRYNPACFHGQSISLLRRRIGCHANHLKTSVAQTVRNLLFATWTERDDRSATSCTG